VKIINEKLDAQASLQVAAANVELLESEIKLLKGMRKRHMASACNGAGGGV
jgi:hypothetical protein